ncbi:hypothetical protein [Enterobacter sp.]|uniref:hypothetical protein n=1 Tax=Enterobacter sp. TaxID=42895 RepID=UPI00296FBCFA|nr:hypothetical protein [Enterobacter sp.]
MSTGTFDLADFLSKAGVGIITGFIAAVVTAKVALNRFYREKSWEKKSQAYNDLVGNLFELQIFYRDVKKRNFLERKGKVYAEGDEINWELGENLQISIKRQLALAPISLSKTTYALVEQFFEDSQSQDWALYIEGMPSEVVHDEKVKLLQKLINEITADAKHELKFR